MNTHNEIMDEKLYVSSGPQGIGVIIAWSLDDDGQLIHFADAYYYNRKIKVCQKTGYRYKSQPGSKIDYSSIVIDSAQSFISGAGWVDFPNLNQLMPNTELNPIEGEDNQTSIMLRLAYESKALINEVVKSTRLPHMKQIAKRAFRLINNMNIDDLDERPT